MKPYCILILSLFIVSFTNLAKQSELKTSSQSGDISQLKTHKDEINAYSKRHKSRILLFAKVHKKVNPIKVINQNWPDDTDYSYNILKGDKGNIVMIMASPTSESGDWDFESTHYFDDKGNTFAHDFKANAFVLPDDGVAYETTTDYYNSNFKLIKHQYKLVDKKGKSLDKKNYGFDAKQNGFDIRIFANVKDCLAAYHLTIR